MSDPFEGIARSVWTETNEPTGSPPLTKEAFRAILDDLAKAVYQPVLMHPPGRPDLGYITWVRRR